MSSSTLYALRQVIQLTTDACLDGNGGLVNYPATKSNFNLLSNVKNTVQFMIRDIDRKVVNVAANASPWLQIYDDGGHVMLEQPLALVSATQGLWSITIERSSLTDWTTQSYSYAVYIKDEFGGRHPLYTDRGFTSKGFCYVMDGPVPPPRQPIQINPVDFINRAASAYSSAYAGAATANNPSGQASAAFYCTGFSGQIVIQATLDMNISTNDGDWFVVETLDFVNQTGTVGQPLLGAFTYVRFVVTATSGTVDKIVYAV